MHWWFKMTLYIPNWLFLHKVLPATDESIRQLTGVKGIPPACLLSPGLPVEDTVLGPVQLGSPLYHHESMALSFSSSSLLNNHNNNNETLIKREPQVYTRAWRTVQKEKKIRLGQYNSSNKLIHAQYTSRYKLHTHTHRNSHTHTHTHTHTHHTTPHSKSNEVVYRRRWREYRFS